MCTSKQTRACSARANECIFTQWCQNRTKLTRDVLSISEAYDLCREKNQKSKIIQALLFSCYKVLK